MALFSSDAPTASGAFSNDQKEYLDGFLRGQFAGRASLDATTSSGPAPYSAREGLGYKAQQAWLAAGKRLSKEEQIKFDGNPLELAGVMSEHADRNELPAGPDNFRFRFHGLFNVAPAQDSLMCRLRIPGGALTPAQLEAVADCAEAYGGGYADITTRANLQIREIAPRHMLALLEDLHDAGIVPRGSGADNIRNVTGNPTAGIDPDELHDVLPLCRAMHHHILMNREFYGLPRKFNIAFDGGSSISALEDTNDIGFRAVEVGADSATPEVPPGTYFRVALGGITGHRDFARDCGLLVRAEECVPVAAAMVKVFIAHGDRGNRNKARLKYVLDARGFDWFLAETEKVLGMPLRRFPREACRFAPAPDRLAHLGVRAQKQAGLAWVGAHVPGGRLTVAQLRAVAALARRYGTGNESRPLAGDARRTVRLTVWQNLLISEIPQAQAAACAEALAALGLPADADPIAAGLVACTGAEGCKFGQAPTKGTARAIEAHLRAARAAGRLSLDGPVNIHLTGCPHSCAQHFIGDLGLIATTIERDGAVRGAFHILVGGGAQDKARIAVPARQGVPCEEVPAALEDMLRVYLETRRGAETFTEFTARHTDAELSLLFGAAADPNSLPESSTLHPHLHQAVSA